MKRGQSDDVARVPPGVRSQRGDPAELPPGEVAAGHERRDASPRGVVLAGAGLAAALAVALPLVGLAVMAVLRSAGPGPRPSPSTIAPEPSVQAAQREERLALEREAGERLSTLAWVDKDRKIVRIPVQEAMRLLAEHGWPDEDLPDAALPSGAGRSMPR